MFSRCKPTTIIIIHSIIRKNVQAASKTANPYYQNQRSGIRNKETLEPRLGNAHSLNETELKTNKWTQWETLPSAEKGIRTRKFLKIQKKKCHNKNTACPPFSDSGIHDRNSQWFFFESPLIRKPSAIGIYIEPFKIYVNHNHKPFQEPFRVLD